MWFSCLATMVQAAQVHLDTCQWRLSVDPAVSAHHVIQVGSPRQPDTMLAILPRDVMLAEKLDC